MTRVLIGTHGSLQERHRAPPGAILSHSEAAVHFKMGLVEVTKTIT